MIIKAFSYNSKVCPTYIIRIDQAYHTTTSTVPYFHKQLNSFQIKLLNKALMIKHFKSRFSKGEQSDNSSKPKSNIEFFQLLKTYMRRPGTKLILNIPETIILNSPNCESVLLFTDPSGYLICQESITNE